MGRKVKKNKELCDSLRTCPLDVTFPKMSIVGIEKGVSLQGSFSWVYHRDLVAVRGILIEGHNLPAALPVGPPSKYDDDDDDSSATRDEALSASTIGCYRRTICHRRDDDALNRNTLVARFAPYRPSVGRVIASGFRALRHLSLQLPLPSGD
ncbi:unnamed protein product [Heligmosomoides polygyrus]|uniref:Uncharacterized protein n=1 Tax=Heligmosomoides polygyrus TaxID=6339 RepID=A0A183FS65_HELPZ|nr:unnamed protein product [Heligmosomoides polygyrus]